MKETVITQTQIGHLRLCPKMYRLSDIEGWRLSHADMDALIDGTDWHTMLALESLKQPVEYMNQDPIKQARFSAMYHAYGTNMGFIPKSGVEISFAAPIINPQTGRAAQYATMAGKIDGLTYQDGEWWIVEHKSASGISEGYISRLSLDFQIHVYARFAQELLGCPVAGVLYDVTQKCTLKGKKDETPGAHYIRVMEWYDANKETAYYRERLRLQDRDIETQLWMYYQEILWRNNHNYWPRNSGQCLNFYGKKCPYFSYCDSGDNQIVLDNFYVKVEPNQELHQKLI